MIEPRTLPAGEKINEPGAYQLTMEQHHSQCCDGPSVSSGGLRKIFGESPKHFWQSSWLNPDYEGFKDTKFTILGRAAHHLFMGEGEFFKHFVIRPDKVEGEAWHGNKTVCKNWLAKQTLAGLTVITPEQVEQIKGMAAAIDADPLAKQMLRGHVELSLVYRDKDTDLWVKVRPDSLPVDAAEGADLKCVSGIDDDFLARTIEDNGYFQQGALCGEGLKNVLGVDLETFAFVFVEQDRPHCVRVESLADEDYDRGWHANRIALRLLRRCLDTNEWPGPRNRDGDGGFMHLRPYQRDRIDRRIERLAKEIAA